MVVNIIMLVKDRPRLTHQAIDSLRRHTPPDLYNLTVLDDGSRFQTAGAIQTEVYHISNSVSVRISKSKGIVGTARNIGAMAARLYWGQGDLLYMSDNDAYFTPGWLGNLLGAWEKAYLAGFRILGGYNHPYQAIAGLEVGKPAPVIEYEHGQIREYYAVGGLSWLMDWKTFDDFGWLEAKAVGVAKSEDWEYAQRLRKAGWKVGAVHPHVVYNCGLTSTFGGQAVGHEAMARIPGIVIE